MVLTQPTQLSILQMWLYMRFHTTMVLTQRGTIARVETSQEQFPYHYGSHATHLEQIVYLR